MMMMILKHLNYIHAHTFWMNRKWFKLFCCCSYQCLAWILSVPVIFTCFFLSLFLALSILEYFSHSMRLIIFHFIIPEKKNIFFYYKNNNWTGKNYVNELNFSLYLVFDKYIVLFWTIHKKTTTNKRINYYILIRTIIIDWKWFGKFSFFMCFKVKKNFIQSSLFLLFISFRLLFFFSLTNMVLFASSIPKKKMNWIVSMCMNSVHNFFLSGIFNITMMMMMMMTPIVQIIFFFLLFCCSRLVFYVCVCVYVFNMVVVVVGDGSLV